MENDLRRRSERACDMLEEAIRELDACGFEDDATHAYLCLERVREQLEADALRYGTDG